MFGSKGVVQVPVVRWYLFSSYMCTTCMMYVHVCTINRTWCIHIIWHAMSDMCCVCVLLTTHILIPVLILHHTCSSILQTCVMCALPVTLYHWAPSKKKGKDSNFFRSFTAYLLTSVAAVVPTVYETKHLSTSSCSYQLLLLLLSYEKEHGLCNWSIIFWEVDVVRVWM